MFVLILSCLRGLREFMTSLRERSIVNCKHSMVDAAHKLRTLMINGEDDGRVVCLSTTSAGGELTTLRRICSDMNFTPPITENAYNRYIRHVEETAIVNCK